METGGDDAPGRDQGCGDGGMMKIREFFFKQGQKVANLIYRIYNCDRERVPYPLMGFLILHMGGWTGVSLFMARRQYQYEMRKKKVIKTFNKIIALLFILFIGFAATRPFNNYLYGFSQELAAEVVFILLVLYILPQYLNRPKKLKIDIKVNRVYDQLNKNVGKFVITLKNTGELVFKKEEVSWEIYIPYENVSINDIKVSKSSVEKNNTDIYQNTWKITGIIDKPLFLEQTYAICRFSKSKEKSVSEDRPPLLIYYVIRTIYGNLPDIENYSTVLLGTGIPFSEYPRIGEIEVT